MRTSSHQSPLVIWHASILQYGNSDDIFELPSELYGVDFEGPVLNIETENNVVVNTISVQLTERENEDLAVLVDPLQNDGNHGINLYLHVRDYLNGLLSSRE